MQNLFDTQVPNGRERRSQPRVPADCTAHLKVFNAPLATGQFIHARMVDVSAKGLQLRVGFIFPNEPVQIRLPGRVLSGQVRYCVSAGDDFLIGILRGKASKLSDEDLDGVVSC